MEQRSIILKIWHKISYLGISNNHLSLKERSIILTNRINFMLLLIMVFLNVALAVIRKIEGVRMGYGGARLLLVLFICFVVIFLNLKKHYNSAKVLLTTAPALFLFILPTFIGFVETESFFYYHIGLLGLSILPHLVFLPTLKNYLYFTVLAFYLLTIIFIDDLLIAFSPSETHIIDTINEFRFFYQVIPIATYFFVHFALFYLRSINIKFEQENNNHISILNETNEELVQSNHTIKSQKEEIEKTLHKLQETQLQLIQAEKMVSLGTLTAGVAHEINNPLNYIMGGSYGIKDYFEETKKEINDDVKLYLKGIDTGIQRISKIVNGLDEFSRNNQRIDETCDIHSILENCLVMLNHKISQNIKIIRDFSERKIIIRGNRGKLHQGFVSILLNSIEAISDNGSITISTAALNEKYLVEFIDNGIGIDKKHLSHITDPFFTTKSPGEGIGLGLSITYSYIKEHKGDISIESELNKGTKVTLSFPV